MPSRVHHRGIGRNRNGRPETSHGICFRENGTRDAQAEIRARRGLVTRMADWATFLDAFLTLNEYPVLPDKGSISALEAKLKAEGEYESFRALQDRAYESDFDAFVEEARRLAAGEEDDDG